MHANLAVLFNKLDRLGQVLEDDRRSILNLSFKVHEHDLDFNIVRIGDSSNYCTVLLEGFACRFKVSPDGQRQIISLHVPGDLLDLVGLVLGKADHNIATVGPSVLATFSHAGLRQVIRDRSSLANLLWQDTLIEAAIYREWIVNIGLRQAPARVAHLFCELLVRLRAVGQAHDHSFSSPFTQQDLADALGLSMVHVNRTLQELRRLGLIELNRGRFLTRNWQALTHMAEFDPTYLCQLSNDTSA